MKVFLSYSQADAKIARQLRDGLVAEGYDVWNAENELAVGSNWYAEAGRVLARADAMIVLLSPGSMRSRSVRFDIEYALTSVKLRNRLIPVLVKPTTNFPWILEQLPLVDVTRDKDRIVGRVMAVLRHPLAVRRVSLAPHRLRVAA